MSRVRQASVDINTLLPNPWNTNVVSPENEKRIENSLKELGMFRPITVRENAEGKLEILGGQHRWEAAKRLGYTEIPIFHVGRIDDKTAKKIGLADNAKYGEDDTLALAGLLKELGTTDELAAILPMDEADFAAIFSAQSIALDDLGLSDSEQETPSLSERPSPTHQLMRFKVPVEDVARVTSRIEQVIREKHLTTEDSLSNAGAALVELCKD